MYDPLTSNDGSAAATSQTPRTNSPLTPPPNRKPRADFSDTWLKIRERSFYSGWLQLFGLLYCRENRIQPNEVESGIRGENFFLNTWDRWDPRWSHVRKGHATEASN